MYLVTVIFLSLCIVTSIGQRMNQTSSASETVQSVARKEQQLRRAEAVMLYAQAVWQADPKVAKYVQIAARYTLACEPPWEGAHVQTKITYEKVREPEAVVITIEISGDFGQERLEQRMACPEK